MKVLVTGAAGFIGSRVAFELARRGDEVIGIDNINNYYDPRLKYDRLVECGIFSPVGCEIVKVKPETGNISEAIVEIPDLQWHKKIQSKKFSNYCFVRMDIADRDKMKTFFTEEKFDKVVNLAAQAGVRYSITNPYAYIDSNIVGFLNILEGCRHTEVKDLVYASSSSVYGLNEKVPFSEDDTVISPVSLYAASKKSNELMAFAYSKLYGLSTTGLRYFTVYGPWGRPDMAPMLFAEAISHGKVINVFNNGDLIRDFTYIDDIVSGTIQVLDKMPDAMNCSHNVPSKVYNIGCSNPIHLMDFICTLERALGRKAKMNMLPMQQGDVYQTNADTTKLETEVGYKPKVNLKEGIDCFVSWYKQYFLNVN